MVGWRQISNHLCEILGNTIFPPACVSCLQDEETLDDSTRLCLKCRAALTPKLLHVCRRCDAPVGPHLDTSFGCIHCRNDRFFFDRVLSLGPYADELRTVCQRLKNHRQSPLTTAMAKLLCERIAAEMPEPLDFVLAVPHHWSTRIGQRAETSELLAESVSRILRVSQDRFLIAKTRRTERQSVLSPAQRRKNLRKAFRLRNRERVTNRRILLVDDVLTTGTTANRIAKLLRDAGAQSIIVAVLARGLGDARDPTPF